MTEKKTLEEIAEIHGVTGSSVGRWLSSYDISRPGRGKKKIPPKELLSTLYVTEEKSYGEIGKIFDVSTSTARKWVKKYGLLRPLALRKPDFQPTREELFREYVTERKALKKVAQDKGVSETTLRKRMAQLGIDHEAWKKIRAENAQGILNRDQLFTHGKKEC